MDEAIRRKLLADGEGMGDERRLILVTKMFMRWSTDGSDVTLRKLKHMLQQSDTAMYKTMLVNQAIARESKECSDLAAKVQQQMIQAQTRFVEWKQRLKDAQQVRKYQQEYELISEMINKYPSRAEMNRRLEQLREDLRNSAERRKHCDAVLEIRRKQAHLLMIALNELNHQRYCLASPVISAYSTVPVLFVSTIFTSENH
ncbi:unnamed protein product [Soboliphyme baturini]|uniref:THO complex subunit 7 homolog n=1 Tax=Soboliphyme baturini TaxID=241478 RepID=A0A183II67_9BILA|nr:unnamed protein product [Soboliphyme baturini]